MIGAIGASAGVQFGEVLESEKKVMGKQTATQTASGNLVVDRTDQPFAAFVH